VGGQRQKRITEYTEEKRDHGEKREDKGKSESRSTQRRREITERREKTKAKANHRVHRGKERTQRGIGILRFY